MPSATPKPAAFYIPSVDITPYLADPASPAAQTVIADIRTACLSTGFFQLLGHGVPADLQARVFAGVAKFFALPQPAKRAIRATKDTGFRGYDLLASQSYEADVLADLKEGFFMGADLAPTHPHVRAKRFFAAPNVWPPEELLPANEFREPLERYYEAMLRLCGTVLDLLAATLPYGPGIFDDFRGPEPACPQRLLHYPPTPPQALAKRQLGASAHTDFSAVTLLLQDEHEGLEVLDRETGMWVLVPPNPDAYVVNLGDMMKVFTRGVYQSSMHRVVNKNKTDRYSVVWFLDGNLDCKLVPVGSTDEAEREKAMTAEEYMFDRMNFSYGKHEEKVGA
ncbi:2-oxoglutarate-dependent dioxygenase mpl2 [Xylographa carneopallida]|nr:2-oxoglutarate-dependent dioxygenase mpl2 [Xylographa carneopallida]